MQIKENIKVLCHWLLWGESTVDQWFPSQMASNAENISLMTSSWKDTADESVMGIRKSITEIKVNPAAIDGLGSLLITQINFNLGMDK